MLEKILSYMPTLGIIWGSIFAFSLMLLIGIRVILGVLDR